MEITPLSPGLLPYNRLCEYLLNEATSHNGTIKKAPVEEGHLK